MHMTADLLAQLDPAGEVIRWFTLIAEMPWQIVSRSPRSCRGPIVALITSAWTSDLTD
jgi:hypothetical protein